MSILMETVTFTRPASEPVLKARLAECLRDREFRQKRGESYGRSISDQWLERDIATLHEAIMRAKAEGRMTAPHHESADTGPHGSNKPDPESESLLLQAAQALECNAMWAEGSEAHPRLLRLAAALRQRIGSGIVDELAGSNERS